MGKSVFQKAEEISNLIGSDEQEIVITIKSGDNNIFLKEKKKKTLLLKEVADLNLTHSGYNKLAIVKLIKEILGVGLREAKELVDEIPSGSQNTSTKGVLIGVDIEVDKAEEIRKKMKGLWRDIYDY